MQQVSQVFDQGERDYSKVSGDSGPLVYPAGFLYAFRLLQAVCGTLNGSIRRGQIVFAAIYLLHLSLVHRLYQRAHVVCLAMHGFGNGVQRSAVTFFLLSLSRRIHSIYVLRMFNDCVAMLFLYAAILLLVDRRPQLSALLYSASVSVKMNTLLFAPAFALIGWWSYGPASVTKCVVIGTVLQVALGAPFLLRHPLAYLRGAFDFGRRFLYEWTVNWRFLPQSVFESPLRSHVLLVSHVLAVGCWARYRFGQRRPTPKALSPTGTTATTLPCSHSPLPPMQTSWHS